MPDVPPPRDLGVPLATLVGELDALLGRRRFVEVCTDLLGGADRSGYLSELSYLTGHDGERLLERDTWKDYWVRSWGARGLLHCWDDAATNAVVAGLADAHYRPAEMCLRVSARHEVAGAGPGAAVLAHHPMPRVRADAVRALGVVGDTEHVPVVLELLDDPEEGVREHAARAYARMAARLDLGPAP